MRLRLCPTPVVLSLILLSLILLAGTVSGAEDRSEQLYSASVLMMDVRLSGSIDLVPESPQAAVEYVTANLSFLPAESSQQAVRSIDYTPKPYRKGTDHTLFRWESPSESLSYEVSADVTTADYLPAIKGTIPFPLLDDLPEDVEQFTLPTEMMDSDSEEIQKLASKLAEGSSDLYEAVLSVAQWVEQNIEYDLTTLTEEATQNASWVLANRYGVCDEISTLFIALVRSLGVPARYVSGMAYTNFEGKDDWGPHGWAEVYFPGVGWVPFDVTYKQFGYVDPTHVVLRTSADSNEPAVRYEWLGSGVDLRPGKLDVGVTPALVGGVAQPRVSLAVLPARADVGFGSSNLIEGRATNLRDGALVADLSLTPVVGMSAEQPLTQYVLLRPGETRSVYWTVQTKSEQKPGYRYTYPLTLTSGAASVSSSFTESERGEPFTGMEAAELFDEKEASSSKSYTSAVLIECNGTSPALYADASPVLRCTFRNAGNTALDMLRMCIASTCATASIPLAKSHMMDFPLAGYAEGTHLIDVSASNALVTKARKASVTILGPPRAAFANLTAPQTVSYGEPLSISFTLTRISSSVPETLVVEVLGRTAASRERLDSAERHVIEVDSGLLDPGENTILLRVRYRDAIGREYSTEETVRVEMEGAPILMRIDSFLVRLWERVQAALASRTE